MKQYKACAPERTIERIRHILSETGIFLKENSRQNGDELFSCRLVAVNDGLEPLGIGTNGKGRSYLYALASGYAEFMERLQNDFLFKFRQKTHSDTITLEQAWHILEKDIRQFNPEITSLEDARKLFSANLDIDKIEVREYVCSDSGKTVLLPEQLLVDSSNGLAAGNTPIEAILQGCCEIFERYAMRRIYFDRLTPADIPVETFKGTPAYRIIQQLQSERGLRVTVKDCSLGLGLPVIGVLIEDEKRGKYNFGFGSDFNINIALERTLTERYQGGNNYFSNPQDIRYVPVVELSSENFKNIFISTNGQWPISIFSGQPSFPFEGINPDYGQSDEQDLRHCLEICRRLDTKMYVSDNSFLGFPAYRIIIPAMSAILSGFDINYHSRLFKALVIRRKLFSDGAPSVEKLIEVIEPWARYAVENHSTFDLCQVIPAYYNIDLLSITPRIFLSMVAMHRGDNEEALRLLEAECRSSTEQNRFCNAMADWLQMMGANVPQKSALSILTRKYGNGLALRTAFWLGRPEAVMQNSGLMSHFNPQNWAKSKSSHIAACDKIADKLAESANNYHPDYTTLANLFAN